MFKMKEQDTITVKQLNESLKESETSNMLDEELQVVFIKILIGLQRRG